MCPVVVMIVGAHREDLLFHKEGGLAVRELSIVSGIATQMRLTRSICSRLSGSCSVYSLFHC